MKRGSEELLGEEMTTTATPSNGNLSPLGADQESKKAKLESSTAVPSKVVHLRNIPPDVTENEVVTIGLPFGKVSNVLLLKGKNQAFLEFADVISAHTMVSYWQNTTPTPTLKGRHIFLQFSHHKELKTSEFNGYSSPEGVILRVVIEHLVYPVTLDTLYSIFSRYGKVSKIVTFTKGGVFQSLIQFESHSQANAAKNALDGQQMFTSGNLLRIDFSKLSSLNVKYNNDKSRDFTNPLLPPGGNSSGSPSVNYSFNQEQIDPMMSGFPPSSFGMQSNNSFTSMRGSMTSSHPNSYGSGYGSVLLISNLNEQMATPDALFTLFGVYGDVIRVKILYNKKDNALVQMLDPQQAQLALTYLDKVKLFGKTLKIAPSKYQMVQMPKDGQPDAGLTKDFTNSTLHRFKKPGSKNYLNIYPPSPTLHLSNIPATVSEEQIREAFLNVAGVEIINFKFFPKDRKMALVQMASVEDSVHALIRMHNYQLSDSNHLRVSFSKSSI